MHVLQQLSSWVWLWHLMIPTLRIQIVSWLWIGPRAAGMWLPLRHVHIRGLRGLYIWRTLARSNYMYQCIQACQVDSKFFWTDMCMYIASTSLQNWRPTRQDKYCLSVHMGRPLAGPGILCGIVSSFDHIPCTAESPEGQSLPWRLRCPRPRSL